MGLKTGWSFWSKADKFNELPHICGKLSVKFSRFWTLLKSSSKPKSTQFSSSSRLMANRRPLFFFCDISKWTQLKNCCMIECQIKGKKVGDMNPQVSCHLKNSTKTVFFGIKSPKTKVCYILPPTVFGTFFERGKSGLVPVAGAGYARWGNVSRRCLSHSLCSACFVCCCN